jgi:tRNA-dihydrouridine synthase C
MASQQIQLYLAPMEGVVDWVLRDILTSIGGIDRCVTEFIRVTDRPIVDKVFYEYCPELKTGSRTRSGVPVYVQLLGGQAQPLAENALRAVELGACGIDLNFGCPAKTVNRHDGGATLLQYPDRIFNILNTVRTAVPSHIPVTAKIRLGFDNPEICIQNALAVEAAGIETMAVHCRTKSDMYKPPAFWEWIPRIKDAARKLNVIANGEIWNNEDFDRCREITGCHHLMIGRGAIANPFIFRQVRGENIGSEWADLKDFLPRFFDASTEFKSEFFAQSRTKQWLAQMGKRNSQAAQVFEQIKIEKKPAIFRQRLVELTA